MKKNIYDLDFINNQLDKMEKVNLHQAIKKALLIEILDKIDDENYADDFKIEFNVDFNRRSITLDRVTDIIAGNVEDVIYENMCNYVDITGHNLDDDIEEEMDFTL